MAALIYNAQGDVIALFGGQENAVVGGILILATAADGSTSESLITNSQIGEGKEALQSAVANSLSKAQERTKTDTINTHHIVAQTAAAALPAQKILKEAGIDINSPYNLVNINQNLHQHLHTKAYYTAVNLIMQGAKSAAEKSGNLKDEVVNVLETMRSILQSASGKLS